MVPTAIQTCLTGVADMSADPPFSNVCCRGSFFPRFFPIVCFGFAELGNNWREKTRQENLVKTQENSETTF
jgi:hypothetical protein